MLVGIAWRIMGIPWGDLAVIFALIALNGFFAAAELAVVSARRARLAVMERAGVRGATAALGLQADQGRFLSAVQIGVTLAGIANGAFSGASLGPPTGQLLMRLGVRPEWAEWLGFALIVVLVSYLSLVIGELVPKQLSLRAPERVAVAIAPVMAALTRLAGPMVIFLDASTALIFRLLRIRRDRDNAVTEEELRHVVQEAEEAGVIEGEERELISGILRFADRPVRGLMTPRREVDWLNMAASEADMRRQLMTTPHTRLLVGDGSVDRIIGVVQARDVLAALLDDQPLSLEQLVRHVPVIPDMADSMVALSALREADVPLAVVIDEYGHFEGVVTPADLLSAIAGEFRSDMDEGYGPAIVEQTDGSWLVAGGLAADELAEKLEFDLPEDRDFQTIAGFALEKLEHIPQTGESFESNGYRFEVRAMDGRKIDRLLISKLDR